MTNAASQYLTAVQLNSLVKEAGGHDQVLRILSGEFKIQLTSESVRVLPDLSHAERIRRGKYDWMKGDLTEKYFPVISKQLGEWEWKLFHFDRTIESADAIRLMKEDDFEAGAIGHILAFGEQHPEEQRKYLIIGLGSVAAITGHCWVPALGCGDGGRTLRRRWFGERWGRHSRFLGVRRVQPAA